MKKILLYLSIALMFSGILLSSASTLFSVTETAKTVDVLNDKCENPMSSQDVIDCGAQPVNQVDRGFNLSSQQMTRVIVGLIVLATGFATFIVSVSLK